MSRHELLPEARLLARADELVQGGWCRTGLARDADGRLVEPWSPSACSWSPLGALLKVWFDTGSDEGDALRIACSALALATGGRIEEWNAARWRTRRHVESAFLRARDYLPGVARRIRATEGGAERSSEGHAARGAAAA